jgi:hypothetical protein
VKIPNFSRFAHERPLLDQIYNNSTKRINKTQLKNNENGQKWQKKHQRTTKQQTLSKENNLETVACAPFPLHSHQQVEWWPNRACSLPTEKKNRTT